MATKIWPIEGVALESDGNAVAGSLAYRILRMYDDNYQPVLVYPTLADGAQVVSSTGTWSVGAYSVVMPSGTVTSDYLINMVTVESMTKDGDFEFILYYGESDVEVGRIRFSYVGGFFGNSVFRMPSVLVPANSKLRARLACSTGLTGGATGTFSVAYRIVT